MERKLIKNKNGVSLYEYGDDIEMYIEEQLVLTISKEFREMIYKSYDNLVELRRNT